MKPEKYLGLSPGSARYDILDPEDSRGPRGDGPNRSGSCCEGTAFKWISWSQQTGILLGLE